MSDQLKAKTTVQLRLMARELDIVGRSAMRKADLVAAIDDRIKNGPRHETQKGSGPQNGASTVAAVAGQAPVQVLETAPPASVQPADALLASMSSSPMGSSISAESASDAPVDGPEPGLPIPVHYQQNRLQLMIQDPHHVYAYWEMDQDQFDRLQQRLGGHLVLLVWDTHGQRELRRVAELQGGYYLAVAAGRTYTAELALQDEQGRIVSLLRSNAVAVPADQPVLGDGDAWMSVQARHERLTLGPDGRPEHAADGSSSLQWARLERVWRHQRIGPSAPGSPGSDVRSGRSGEGL
jgi:hypothetical protein